MSKTRVMATRWISGVLTYCLLLMMLPVQVWATDIVANGTCGRTGSNLIWTLNSDGTLTISGKGEMRNYCHSMRYNGYRQFSAGWDSTPWEDYSDKISNVVIENGVSSIGGKAFYNLNISSVMTY